MKKVLFLAAVMALVAAPAGAYPWMGGLNGAGNLMTGNNSSNTAIDVDVDATVVGNTNDATVVNTVTANSNTGRNGVYDNSGDVRLTTGDSASVAFAQNQVNTNRNVVFDGCGCGEDEGMNLAANGMTGKNSDNLAVNADVDLLLVGNSNNASVINGVTANSNTGYNEVAGNGGNYSEEVTRRRGSHTWGSPMMLDLVSQGHHNDKSHHDGMYYGEHSYYNRSVSYPMGGNVTVATGDSYAEAGSVNVVNTNVNRVVRGGMYR